MAKGTSPVKQRSVLIVDDELLIRDLLYDFFTEQSWEVAVAGDASAALEKLESADFDIVLTDLKMPEMDGSTFIDRIRETHPELPVIVVTGYPSVDSAIRSLRQRVDDYLIKPFNVTSLYRSVESSVSRHKNDEIRVSGVVEG